MRSELVSLIIAVSGRPLLVVYVFNGGVPLGAD